MKCILSVIILMYCQTCFTQIQKPQGSENLALFNSNAAIENQFSGFHNPATLAFIDSKWNIGTAVTNFYFLKQLNQIGLSSQFRVGKGRIQIGYSVLGGKSYMENLVNLAYGIQIFKGFSIGISMNYVFKVIGREKEFQQGVFPTIGVKYKYKNAFAISFSVENPLAVNWLNSQEKLPVSFDSSLEFFFAKSFRGLLSIGKSLNSDLKLKIGFEYTSKNKKLVPRIGFSILPLGFSVGLSFQTSKLNFGFAMLYVSNLGPVSSFDFSYEK